MMKNITLILLASVVLGGCAPKSKIVVEDKVPAQATFFDLKDVRLLDGSAFKHAMDVNGKWLLDLEPDRFLHRFRLFAGLEPKGEIYKGWESEGVSGHTLGHYLTACSQMYAASGDERYKERVDYIVDELAECQAARKTGYVGGMPNEDKVYAEVSAGDIRSAGFDLNGGWVPLYTMHKIWAGLIDSYLLAGNQKAKDVVVKLSDWAVNTFDHLTDEQIQQVLACEHGGLNESFAQVYAITGDERYLRLAEKFYHKAILTPLAEQRDELEGEHANTQVPKLVGLARIYELTGNTADSTAAAYFWDRMINHHSYVIGGNSDYEHLGHPDCLNDRLSTNTAETCNTYNLLKLTRHLFGWKPDANYMDYYERALYNHILAAQNPADGMVCYYVALKSGTEKVYSTPFDSFWCCVGSGIENPTKYAESVYAKAADGGLFVNLFIPTELTWKERGLKVKMETDFPNSDKVKITFDGKKQSFPLYLRQPKWAENVTVSVNGEAVNVSGNPGDYITIDGEWGKGTVLEYTMPMSVYTEAMPDNDNRIALLYGPVVLAAELGKEPVDPLQIPVFISSPDKMKDDVVRVSDDKLVFKTQSLAYPSQVQLVPFQEISGQKHAVYFDCFTPEQWVVKKKEYEAKLAAIKALEARTVDIMRLGEMQPERDHNLSEEKSSAGEHAGYKFRHAHDGGWFAFDMKVDPKVPMALMCKYWGPDKGGRKFDILVDDQLLVTEELTGKLGSDFVDVEYRIPSNMVAGKDKVRIKFDAHDNSTAGGVFGARIIKK